jgi:hypothetical protein
MFEKCQYIPFLIFKGNGCKEMYHKHNSNYCLLLLCIVYILYDI